MNSNELISLTIPQIPSTETSLKNLELPFCLIIRPFLYDTPKIPHNILRIPKCSNCSAYFSPLTQWIHPHSRYNCCMCHEVLYDQHQRFINLDKNRQDIPELKEMCVEYCGNYSKENIPIKKVIICDKSIFNQMKVYFQQLSNAFVVILCDDTVSVINRKNKQFHEQYFMNLENEEIVGMSPFLKKSKNHQMVDFCENYQYDQKESLFYSLNSNTIQQESYKLKECIELAIQFLGYYGIIECFHSNLFLSKYSNEMNEKNKNKFIELSEFCLRKGIMINHYFIFDIHNQLQQSNQNEINKKIDSIDYSLFREMSRITNGNFVVNPTIDLHFVQKIQRKIVGFTGETTIHGPNGIDFVKAYGNCVSNELGESKIGMLTEDFTIVVQCHLLNEIKKIKHQIQVSVEYIGLNGMKCLRVLNVELSVCELLGKLVSSINTQTLIASMATKFANHLTHQSSQTKKLINQKISKQKEKISSNNISNTSNSLNINSNENNEMNQLKRMYIKKYDNKLSKMLTYIEKNQPLSTHFNNCFNRINQLNGIELQEYLFNLEQCHRNIPTYLLPKTITMNGSDKFLIISDEILVVNCSLTKEYAEELKQKFGITVVNTNWQQYVTFIDQVLHQYHSHESYFKHLLSLQ